MPVGFEVVGDNGYVLANSEWWTHVYVTQGSGSTYAPWYGRSTVSQLTVTVSKGWQTPIVALKCSSATALYGRRSDASYWYFDYMCSGAVGTSYSFYVFEMSGNLGGSTFGFDVVQQNGWVTFSAARHPMSIVGVFSGPTSSATVTGRTLAIAHAGWSGYRTLEDEYWEYNGQRMIPDNEPPGQGGWIKYGQYTAYLYGGYVSGSSAYAADVTWDSVAKLALMDGYETPINTTPNPFSLGYKPHLVVDVTYL